MNQIENEATMKSKALKIGAGEQMARSVLDGGSPRPLSKGTARTAAAQSAGGPAHSKTWRSLVALFGFILLHSSFCLRVQGQSYSIDWYKIAGGGGTSTGGTYQVSGTIGQPDASGAMSGGPVTGTNYYSVSGTIGQPDASGAMTGGNYSLTGGFWSLVDVVQTPGGPTLYISHSSNTVTVCWQAVSGWNLIQSGNLTTPMGSWSASSGITTSNGTNAITLTPPVGNLFFRLQQ
jgi:hypothetical protein